MAQATQNEGERPPGAPVGAAPNGGSTAAVAESNQAAIVQRDPTLRLKPREVTGAAAVTVSGGSKEARQNGDIASESKSQSDGAQPKSQPKKQKHMRLNSLQVTKTATKRKRDKADVPDSAAGSGASAQAAAKAPAASRPKKFRGPQFMTVNGEKGARAIDTLSKAEAQASATAHF